MKLKISLFLFALCSGFLSIAQNKGCTALEINPTTNRHLRSNHIDSSGRGLADNFYLWDLGTTLKVKFLSGSKALQNKVKAAAAQWTALANIKFTYVTSGPADIRIFIGKGNGHSSFIGTYNKIIPQEYATMQLDSSDFLTASALSGTVIHEFGHALGLLHEHESPISGIKWDKEKIYEEYWKCCEWTKEKVDANVFGTYLVSYTNGTSYDSKSIMHYPIEKGETINGYVVPWNRQLSVGDKALIKLLYPKQGKRKNVVPRVSVNKFSKFVVQTNDQKGGLSIYPTFELAGADKTGTVYVIAEFYDEAWDHLEDSDGIFAFEDRVAAWRTVRVLPGKKTSYNLTKKDFEIFIPYNQVELYEGQEEVKVLFRVVLETDEGEIKDIYYGYDRATSLSVGNKKSEMRSKAKTIKTR